MELYRSNRMEALVDALARSLATPLGDPFAPELIVIQSRGMQRWLSMELAQRLGVFAHARFLFPRELLSELLAEEEERDAPTAAARAFTQTGLAWAVLALLDALADGAAADRRAGGHVEGGGADQPADAAVFAPLLHYVRDDRSTPRVFQLAQRIARTFDQYALYRPDMVQEWEDGGGEGWQPILWRRMVQRLTTVAATAEGDDAPPQPLHAAQQAARFFGRETPPAAPFARVSIFGIASLPPLLVRALERLPASTPARVFTLSPSRAYWADVRSQREILRELRRRGGDGAALDGAALDELHLELGNPLLASLGRLGRDFQQILESGAGYEEDARDLYGDPTAGGRRDMLATLQADILDVRHRAAGVGDAPPLPLAPDDRTVSIHACHGPMREVEVLRDQLLDLFESDPTLQPSDVAVMAPDVELYAPLVHAVFDREPGTPGFIPYRIADRSERRTNPVVDAFLGALAMVRGRLAASETLDLLARPPVRERFGIAADDLDTLRRWVSEAGVRWGADERQRERFGQPACREHTWRFGLDRLLLGWAMRSEPSPAEAEESGVPLPERRLFGGTCAYDEIEGKLAQLLGRFADYVDTLTAQLRLLERPRPAADWPAVLQDALSALVHSDDMSAPQHQALREAFDEVIQDARAADHTAPVDVEILSSLLTERFESGRPSTGFLTGGVTICALVPMRSVPFRVLYLLGMNDGAFPRTTGGVGFDLVRSQPRAGDRSLRDDDRYLFLEALLSARDRLVISYVGRDIRDDAELPPSVVVADLLDTLRDSFYVPLDESAPAPSMDPVRRHIVLQHPMQPFSARYFDPSDEPRLFAYSEGDRAGAAALAESEQRQRHFFPHGLPARDDRPAEEVLELEDLCRFVRSPAAWLLRNELGLRGDAELDTLEDREPTQLVGLERYAVGAALFQRRLAELPGEAQRAVLRAEGALPPGAIGDVAFDAVARDVEPLVAAAREIAADEPLAPLTVDIPIELPTDLSDHVDGEPPRRYRLRGQLTGLWPRAMLRGGVARITDERLLETWVRHLALGCAAPDCVAPVDYPRWTALVGRDKRPVAVFEPVDDPLTLLAGLVALWERGRREPLPFFPSASAEYVRRYQSARKKSPDEESARETALAAATRSFVTEFPFPGEAHLPEVRRAFDDRDPLAPDFALADGAGAPTPGWTFSELAERVFGPLLAARREALP